MKCLSFYTIISLWSLFFDHASAQNPWAMTWSDSTFGFDGPWHAVTIYMGGNDTKLAMYPGTAWTTYVLLNTLCDNTTASSYCYGDHAGLFNPDNSHTWDGDSIDLPPHHNWLDLQWGVSSAVSVKAYAYRALESIDLGGTVTSDSNLIAIEQGYQTYPGGKIYPLDVGILALGAPDINQTFSTISGPSVNGTFVTSWVYEHSVTPSYSYGMHIGSPKFGIPGSLYLGGYDKNRVLGDISTQPIDSGQLPIEMLDISIGVLDGGSIWGSSNITGLMAKSNSSLSSGMNVVIDATNPYIYMPQSTCDAITANLPVSYHSDLGLYTWDTNNENYSKIITSPSYLAFTFVKNDVNTEEFTIKVPFALLNLTLSPPLVEVDTPYLPLMPTDSDLVLGRAFLQAAFYGVHWSQKYWFLSQAPGPDDNFIKNVVSLEPTTTTIEGTGDSWEGTWASYWTALPSNVAGNHSETNSSSSSSSSGDSSTGLSTGAKIGIGIGCGCAAIAIIGMVAWFWIRRRRQAKIPETLPPREYFGPRLVQQGGVPLEIAGSKRDTLHELNHDPDFTGYYDKRTSGQTSTVIGSQGSTRGSEGLVGGARGPYELSQ
ncbi:hypothetical protein N7527_008192 [Penicillium freii]|uniref:Peptidase A1 domain-containing protein n=1 Tax=Penicillium freii TaxID=48697 RepID=A0A101MBJ2_PENFR|nr:hypothetical protein N7527_008192 [Penicillium freii]KUM57450.1 hypothetical protein ACN42_g9736 [Penicillium freii]